MNGFKLIVAGGRDYTDYEHLSRVIFAMADVEFADNDLSIVSNQEPGASELGYQFAKDNFIPCYSYFSDLPEGDQQAMANNSDGLLAFWDGRCKDAKKLIAYMRLRGKFVHIVPY